MVATTYYCGSHKNHSYTSTTATTTTYGIGKRT